MTSPRIIFAGTPDFAAQHLAALIASPHLRRALPGALSVEEVEALLAAPGTQGWQAQRDSALLEVLYATGIRVSELVNLRLSDLNPERGYVTVFGKGSKQRIVPFGEQALLVVEDTRTDSPAASTPAARRLRTLSLSLSRARPRATNPT